MESQPTSEETRTQFEFSGPIWYWRGPAPFHFLTVPEAQSRELKAIVHLLTYGWGMIPVQARIGQTEFSTAMFHKDGLYVLPIKESIRKAEGVDEGDHVTARIEVKTRA